MNEPIPLTTSDVAYQKLVMQFEDALRDLPGAGEDLLDDYVRHYFAPGVYARELTIPAGYVLTGKIHKTEHLNIVSKGKIIVVSNEGRRYIEAPFTMVSKPGVKRVGYALEDTVWTTIHVTDETDLEKIENLVIAKSFAELEFDKPELLE